MKDARSVEDVLVRLTSRLELAERLITDTRWDDAPDDNHASSATELLESTVKLALEDVRDLYQRIPQDARGAELKPKGRAR